MENLEKNIRQEYLDTMRRFEEGEDVSILDVLKVAFKYYFSNSRQYFQTFFRERVKFRKPENKTNQSQ